MCAAYLKGSFSSFLKSYLDSFLPHIILHLETSPVYLDSWELFIAGCASASLSQNQWGFLISETHLGALAFKGIMIHACLPIQS